MQIGRPIEPRRLPWRKIAVAVGLVVMTFAYVIYCRHQPMSLNTYALFDDQWFVRAAQRIMAGQWLGPYDQTTLIKGPGFAYFLVVNHVLGLSLATSLALTYAAASAAISWALWRELGLDTRLSVALYALLLWEPAVVPNRVIRDAFYHSMFLFVMATVIVLALDRTPWVRYSLASSLASPWGGSGSPARRGPGSSRPPC